MTFFARAATAPSRLMVPLGLDGTSRSKPCHLRLTLNPFPHMDRNLVIQFQMGLHHPGPYIVEGVTIRLNQMMPL